jgi:hypothetical protein
VTLKVLGRSRRRKSALTATPRDANAATPAAGRRDEVSITAGLAHPNLVSALHAGRQRGVLVLVLEYVQGIDLEQFIAESGPLPVALAWEVLRQSSRALAYLHERGLVHRDVKPANLVLGYTGPGGSPVVKLIDLGLACRAGVAGDELCGTVDYLAPERGSGEPADIRADLYSLGCTLYHLLAGQVPHPGGSWTDKLLRHRMEQPAALASLRPDVPPRLGHVVARLMAPDPADRFANPAALLEALDRPPRRAAPPRTPAKVRRPSRRRWMPAAVCVLSAVLVGALLGGAVRVGWLGSFAYAPVALPEPPRITVSGRQEEFTDLETALKAAPATATLVLHGPGPYQLRPTIWHGKSLTLRGDGESRLRVERADAAGLEWEALLSGEGDVVLQGLEVAGGDGVDRAVPLVAVSGGKLTVRDCKLTGRTAGPLVALRRGKSLRLERCEVDALAQAVAVEQAAERGVDVTLSDSRLHVRNVTGVALLLWADEARQAPPGRVEMRGCRVEAGRVLACRALGGQLDVRAEQCRFVFHQALLSLDACPDGQRLLKWRERGNAHTAAGAWFRLDGRPTVWDEAGWRRLW